jgi:hypothetical protein
MQHWANWEAVFSMRSLRQIRDAKTEELLREVISVRSSPRCYKQDKSNIKLVLRQLPANKDVNTEVEGSTAFETVTRKRLWKTTLIEKI